ncbi:hypothetical protein DFH07DRAFT_825189 [Mycena maculata]|uniref:Uncharacterized protein n=1 Tax=Mycena maculata TaxID=230809 RepID=A0AAD7IZ93_9AGAR|nr:hypothetical protein DFH07DRAFT_825189 [Mycena maculata]
MSVRNRAVSRRKIQGMRPFKDSEPLLQFLKSFQPFPSLRSLQLFGCFQPNIHLGLFFYDELYDIEFYWDSLTPVRRAISKHFFLLDYTSATEYVMVNGIFWSRGRGSHGVFPRPSPPTWRLLTLMNPEGRLRIVIAPEGDEPMHYPRARQAPSVTRATLSWLDSEFQEPSTAMAQESLILAVYRIVMVASEGDTIVCREFEENCVLGELVVQNSERWESNNHFRHYLPVCPPNRYKWTWYDNMDKVYHGIPGWTRFTLHRRNVGWGAAITIIFGDEGDNVEDWSVLLSCLRNWTGVDADLRAFCLNHCTGSTQVGFVTQLDFGSVVNGGFSPCAGFDAADTIYFFIEDLQVEADGRVAPCRGYHSLDPTGATPMSAALKILYGVDDTVSLGVRKRVQFFSSEQFAVLDELWTRSASFRVPSSGPWRDRRVTLKRSQSATLLATVDWRRDWMWEDLNREEEEFYRRRQRMRWRWTSRGPELDEEESAEEEAAPEKKDPVCRLHRSKTKSVGGGLSLIFSRVRF